MLIVELVSKGSVSFLVHKIVVGMNRLSVVNDTEKARIYEKLGDYSCAIGANHRAISFYEKTVTSGSLEI